MKRELNHSGVEDRIWIYVVHGKAASAKCIRQRVLNAELRGNLRKLVNSTDV
jgi:hypothetical protein